jgi:cytidylate kinase
MSEAGFTVAIDGPAAAGKGTISRAVAEAFGFAHLDTGQIYRAVGMKVLEAGADPADPAAAEPAAQALSDADLAHPGLRTPKAADAASKVAAIPGVRAALLQFQRDFARRPGGAVLDGRDIGTVVCPEADVKLYVTADDETRATRRWKELHAKGDERSFKEIAFQLAERDARDQGRADAPLKPAEDAVLLDTTELDIDAAVAEAAVIIKKRLGQG